MRYLTILDGLWHFRPGPDRHGTYAAPHTDDGDWDRIRVPAHWHNEGYAYYAGEAWYRTRFPAPALLPGERCLLRFEAVDYACHVWLNGACLGEHEGYFAPFSFDVTPHLCPGENTLVVQVTNPPDAKRLVKGALMRWDCADPQGNPGGIWQSVHLMAAAPTEFGAVRTRTTLVAGDTPLLQLLARVEHRGDPLLADLSVRLEPANFEGRAFSFKKRVGLYPGEQELAFDFELPGAQLWWPWDWGHPALYNLSLQLEAVAGGAPLAGLTRHCGLRQVTRGDRWAFYINGRHIFLRGANYLSDQYMSTMTPERYRRDVALARGANMNALLPFGNVERPEFYRVCDQEGMLVLQYMSIQYVYDVDDDYIRRASRVLDEMVDLLDPHPCVIGWVMNGEPDEKTNVTLGRPLAERCRTLDPSRPVHVGSHIIRGRRMLNDDSTLHDWLAKFCHYTGVVSRATGRTGAHSLVLEVGHQALPGVEMLREIGVREMWPPDWETIAAHNGFRDELLQYESEGAEPARTIEALIDATQRYQGEYTRAYIEHLRCHRFSRCNGVFQFHLVDCWPAVTWSVVDYGRQPKASYGYLREAFAPVTVVPDCPPVFCLSGEAVDVPLYAINDTPVALAGCRAVASVRDASQRVLLERSWTLDLPANSSLEVDVLRWQWPRVTGQEVHSLEIRLSDAQGEEIIAHRYRLFVCPSYPVPMADPDFLRGDWSWCRCVVGDAAIEYAREGDQTFGRLSAGRSGSAMAVNRIPLRTVKAGDRLAVSLLARAAGPAQGTAQFCLAWEATEPVELGPEDSLICLGAAGEPCTLSLPADGACHALQGTLVVPADLEERELHLACRYAGQSPLDVRGLRIVRSAT